MNRIISGILLLTTISVGDVNEVNCKGCHGGDYEISALGVSKIVKDMSQDEVRKALLGYKNGTYGGIMKGVMHTNVKMYTNQELKNTNIGLKNKIVVKTASSSIDLISCKNCHGHNFEKSALGSSKIVRDMTKNDIVQALIGYKNGTYGRNMKGIMIEKVNI